MVKQDRHYIMNRKKHFFIRVLIWLVIVGGIFTIGLYLTHKRANVLTILAAVLVIPLAQNITRYISFRGYKDPEPEYCDKIESIEGNIAIYHGGIIPDEIVTLYVDHIVVTARSIYFLCAKEKDAKVAREYLIKRLKAKGIDEIVITEVDEDKKYETICSKIAEDASQNKESLEAKNTIIEGILM